jgi:CBS domain-containing protein
MTRSVVITTPAISVKDAVVVLARHGITLLPVIDETDRLVGVVTEADVVRKRIPLDPRHGVVHAQVVHSSAQRT